MKSNISYITSTDGINPDNLSGFFENWSNPPSTATHLKILKNSDFIVLAVDKSGSVIGFVTAITDKVLSAYIPFLEVLPDHRDHGIGHELIKRILEQLKDYYMIDLLCDPELQNYYEKLGMKKATGMMIRNYDKQLGK